MEAIVIKNLVKSDFARGIPIIKGSRIQCRGEIQSGKTSQIIQLAIYRFTQGYSVFIVNQMLKDCHQMKKRFEDLLGPLMKVVRTPFSYSGKAAKEAYRTLSGNHIFIANSHKTKLHDFHDYATSTGLKFYVIVDESDAFNSDVDMHAKEGLSGSISKLVEILELADGFCGFTGTDYSHTHLRDYFPLYCKNMFYLPVNPDYVSYMFCPGKLRVKALTTNLYLSRANPTWNQEQLELFYRVVEEEKINAPLHGAQIPVMIINVATEIAIHHYIADTLLKRYPKTTIIMVNNSEVILNEHRKFKMVQEALSHVQSELKKHEFVAIITSKQMSRGTSPRSEVRDFSSVKQIIYATSIVYGCSEERAVDEMRQSVLRISGIFPDRPANFQLRVYTTKELYSILKNQHTHDLKNIEEIKKPENADKLISEVITPFEATVDPSMPDEEFKVRRMTSRSRGAFTAKKFTVEGKDIYECTADKISIRTKEMKDSTNSDDSENGVKNTQQKIMETLKKNSWLTAKDIHSMRTDWNLRTKGTDVISISTACIKMMEKGQLERRHGSKGVYEYNVVV